MPRNPDRRARIPSITGKLQAIRGLPPPEKALFLRVGALVDALIITQRKLANPNDDHNKKVSVKVPVPQNVTPTGILDGVELSWSNVDFNSLLAYEVQYDSSAHFPSPNARMVGTNRTTIRDSSTNTDLYFRVRTISRKDGASEWSTTSNLTLIKEIYETDSDSINPENRTTVNPRPELLGSTMSVISGARVFVGTGACTGPGPITLTDFSNTQGNHTPVRHQITYRLEENDSTVEEKSLKLPTLFNESTQSSEFYPFADGYSVDASDREFTVHPGSFSDFFYGYALTTDPSNVDVKFLGYISTPHEETGTIVTASHGLIKG